MSRALKKAVEAAKQRKEGGEVNVPDEGIANLEDVPELCESLIETWSSDLRIDVCGMDLNHKFIKILVIECLHR